MSTTKEDFEKKQDEKRPWNDVTDEQIERYEKDKAEREKERQEYEKRMAEYRKTNRRNLAKDAFDGIAVQPNRDKVENKFVDINALDPVSDDEEELEKKKKENELKKTDMLFKQEADEELAEKVEKAKEKGTEIGERLGEHIEQQVDKKLEAQKTKVIDPNEKKGEQPEVQPKVVDINAMPEEAPKQEVPDYHPEYKFSFDAESQIKTIVNGEKNDPDYSRIYEEDGKAEVRRNEVASTMGVVGDIVKQEQEMHPEYFANPMMAQERVNIISAVVMDQNGLLPEGSVAQQMAKEHPAVGLTGVEKTLTDLHKNPTSGKMEVRIEDLFENGFVLDEKGQMIQGGKRPWEKLDYANKMIAEGKPVYAMSRTNKVVEMNLGESEIHPEGIHAPEMKIEEKLAPKELGKLVNPNVKKETIAQLKEVKKILDSTGVTRSDPEEFKRYKEALNGTIEGLEGTAFKADFNKQLDVLKEISNEFYFGGAAQNKNEVSNTRSSTCNFIKQIANAAQKDKVPDKEVLDIQDSIRRDIAAKAVKTFATANLNSKDSVKKGISEHILSDAETFDKEVDKAMRDPAFVSMFGSKGNNIVSEAQLRKISQQSGKEICKAVTGRTKEMQEAGLARQGEASKRQSQYGYGKWREVSVPVKKGAGEQIAELKEKLEKLFTTYGGTEEFNKLKHEVDIANIRLQGGPKQNIHYPRMMAKIADASADFEKKLLGQGKIKKSDDVFDITGKCKKLYEDVQNNKVPTGKVDPVEAAKQRLADKITLMTAKNMQKDSSNLIKKQGDTLLADRNMFSNASQDLMKSSAFEHLIKDSFEGKDNVDLQIHVENLLKMKPADLNKALNKSVMKHKGLSSEELSKQQQTKTKQAKEKELEAAKSTNGPSAVFGSR